jgi:hypothetical protein
MARFVRLLVLAAFVTAPAALTVTLSGCGGGEKVGDAKLSPEAQKADTGGQKAMEDFYRTKTQKKKR